MPDLTKTTTDDFANMPKIEPGIYRHFKGHMLEVIDVGCHTETLEYFVVYKKVNPMPGMPKLWIRPYNMFFETVERDGEVMPRFQKVD